MILQRINIFRFAQQPSANGDSSASFPHLARKEAFLNPTKLNSDVMGAFKLLGFIHFSYSFTQLISKLSQTVNGRLNASVAQSQGWNETLLTGKC